MKKIKVSGFVRLKRGIMVSSQRRKSGDGVQKGAVSFLCKNTRGQQAAFAPAQKNGEEIMTEEEIRYVKACVEKNIHLFYVWSSWKHIRQKVLEMDHHECQRCKAKKIYTKATTVHHVNYVKRHPELALEIWYEWNGVKKRNLISLCHDCHEAVHGYRKQEKKKPLTEERWD